MAILNSVGSILIALFLLGVTSADESLVGHWKLQHEARDTSPSAVRAEVRGVEFQEDAASPVGDGAAVFDGRGAHVHVPACPHFAFGTGDFTVSLWVHTDESLTDDLGDLVSCYDPKSRTGWQLSLRNNAGVTHCQANYRQLQFGIDAGTEPKWTDHGRPGRAVFGQSLAVHDGHLYVGTCEAGKDSAGHVFRHNSPGAWTDLGAPDRANSVTAMAAYRGELYVGSGKYRLGGSALAESENPHLGGRIFRLTADDGWIDCGQLPNVEAVGGMVVFGGKLYAGSLYQPAGFFRYEGDRTWTPLPVPNGKRVEALGVFNGALYATGYDEGHVYRFDGERWTDLGQVGEFENTQTYAFAAYRGRLCVATWRSGRVFALTPDDTFADLGRLGEELEVMGMAVHNGRLYGGTLPSGQVYRYDGDARWTLLKQLDETPDVKYRRVWTMAQSRGELFCTTLPSGHVWSLEAGKCVTWDREFPPGWHHVAAQRAGRRLRLFVDGRVVAESSPFDPRQFDLAAETPLEIGAGAGDFFHGKLADVRLYRRALSDEEVLRTARPDRAP